MNNDSRGMVHIYTGNGKGKTTAGIGLCCRCAGRGGKVLATAFLKDFNSGEYMFAAPFDTYRGAPFFGFWNDLPLKDRAAVQDTQNNKLQTVFSLCDKQHYDMLLLDEVLLAAHLGAVSEALLCDLLSARPPRLEVVMTGRCCNKALYSLADYVSEISAVKHPFSSGVACRSGIEK